MSGPETPIGRIRAEYREALDLWHEEHPCCLAVERGYACTCQDEEDDIEARYEQHMQERNDNGSSA